MYKLLVLLFITSILSGCAVTDLYKHSAVQDAIDFMDEATFAWDPDYNYLPRED